MNQPAPITPTVRKIAPFALIGLLLVIGVIGITATSFLDQNKNEQFLTTTTETATLTQFEAPLATPTPIPLGLSVTPSSTNDALVVSLDPGSQNLDQAISFSIDLVVSPTLNVAEPVPAPDLVSKNWSYPVTITEAISNGTSIRIAGISINPTPFNGPTEIARIPVLEPFSYDELKFTLLPELSLAYDKNAVEYQLVLAN